MHSRLWECTQAGSKLSSGTKRPRTMHTLRHVPPCEGGAIGKGIHQCARALEYCSRQGIHSNLEVPTRKAFHPTASLLIAIVP